MPEKHLQPDAEDDSEETQQRPSAGRPGGLEYQEVTDPGFGAQAPSFEALPIRGGVILRGPCPRCGDIMEFPYVTMVYRGRRLPQTSAPGVGPQPKVVRMMCTCTGHHPGRPAHEQGCGAYWNITLESAAP